MKDQSDLKNVSTALKEVAASLSGVLELMPASKIMGTKEVIALSASLVVVSDALEMAIDAIESRMITPEIVSDVSEKLEKIRTKKG